MAITPLHKKPNKFRATFLNMLRERGETILVYPGIEREKDDMEKKKFVKLLNPIPIKAIVKDFSPSSSIWQTQGLANTGAKELTMEKKHKNMMEVCKKMIIRNESYVVFKDASGSKLQIWELSDVTKVVVTKL